MRKIIVTTLAIGLLLAAGAGVASASTDDRTRVTGNGLHGGQWRVENADGDAQGPWRHDRATLRLGGGWSVRVEGGATCRSVDWDGFNTGVISSAGIDGANCYGWDGDEGL
jgi:hypothetical protein